MNRQQVLVFVQREAYDEWIAHDEEGVSKRVKVIKDVPILRLFKYLYDSKDKSLIMSAPVEWSLSLSREYYPDLAPRSEFELEYYSPLNPAILKWYDKMFSGTEYTDEEMQMLTPNATLEQIRALVEKEDFTRLVREVGGVNPLVLAARFQCEQSTVQEAHILAELTRVMKEKRKVWLHSEEFVHLQDPMLSDAATRLHRENVLVFNKHNCVAIKWAADVHDAFMQRLGDESQYRFIHTPEKDKIVTLGMFKSIPKKFMYNTVTAVDHIVDRKMVAITMLDVDWEGEPDLDDAQVVASLVPREMVTMMPPENKVPLHFRDVPGAMNHLKDMPDLYKRRTLVASLGGRLSMDTYRGFTCLVTMDYDRISFKQGTVVFVEPVTVEKQYFVSVTQNRREIVSAPIIHALTVSASSCTYEALLVPNPPKYDRVVLIGNSMTHVKWKLAAMKSLDVGGVAYFVCIGNVHTQRHAHRH